MILEWRRRGSNNKMKLEGGLELVHSWTSHFDFTQWFQNGVWPLPLFMEGNYDSEIIVWNQTRIQSSWFCTMILERGVTLLLQKSKCTMWFISHYDFRKKNPTRPYGFWNMKINYGVLLSNFTILCIYVLSLKSSCVKVIPQQQQL